MLIEYTILEDDLLNMKLYKLKSQNNAFAVMAIRFIGTMILAFIALKAYDDYQKFDQIYLFLITIFFGVAATNYFAFFYFIRELLFKRNFAKSVHSPSYQAILGVQSIEVTAQTFKYVKDEFVQSENRPFLKAVTQDEVMIYLQINSNLAYLMPKRTFGHPQEISDFLKLMDYFIIKGV